MCATAHFSSQGGSRGAKLGSKKSQSNRTGNIASDLCFLRFAGAKVGT